MTPPPLATTFVSFAVMCRQYGAEDLAEIPFRFGDEESALALAQGLYDLQHSLGNVDLDALDAVTAAFRGDILTNLGHEPTRRPELVFWLIVCASFPMRLGVDRRRLDLLRRWAILSSVEDYAEGAPLDVPGDRLTALRDLPEGSFFPSELYERILEWAVALYWYSWSTGDLLDLAFSQAGETTRITLLALQVVRGPGEVLCVRSAEQIAQWATRYARPLAREVAGALLGTLDDDGRDRTARGRVLMALATSLAQQVHGDSAEFASRVLREFPEVPMGHERFALLSATTRGDPDAITATLDEFRQAAAEHVATVAQAPAVDRLYAQTRMFGVVGPVVFALVRGARLPEARAILGAWLGLAEIRSDLAWLLINAQGGVIWAANDNALLAGSSDVAFNEMVAAMNRTLGVAISNATAGGALTPDLRSDGTVSPREAPEFEAAVRRRLRIEQARELVTRASDRGEALVVASWLPLPYQALMMAECGRALPISSSLLSPRPDRVVRRAALWTAGVESGALEVSAVQALFAAAAVQCEVFDMDLSIDLFRRIYESPDYDVIWLATHGSWGAASPEESALELDRRGGLRLQLGEILSYAVPEGRRRLLFLNACSAGSSAAFGGLAQFGLAAAVAGPSQAVIAHLWPVNDNAAAGFGVVLSRAIADGLPFAASFSRALSDRAAARGELASLVRSQHPSAEALAAAIEAERIDFGNLLRWASPVMFE